VTENEPERFIGREQSFLIPHDEVVGGGVRSLVPGCLIGTLVVNAEVAIVDQLDRWQVQ